MDQDTQTALKLMGIDLGPLTPNDRELLGRRVYDAVQVFFQELEAEKRRANIALEAAGFGPAAPHWADYRPPDERVRLAKLLRSFADFVDPAAPAPSRPDGKKAPL
jgi:hypothetical protein